MDVRRLERGDRKQFRRRSVSRILILHGRAQSVPRTTHAGRFDLFASFVRILASHVNVGACLGSAAATQSPLPHSAGPGTDSSVPSPVVSRTALRERRTVERDRHPCPHLGWVAVLGVQTCWILGSGLYGLRGKRRVVYAPSAHSCMRSAAEWAGSPERGESDQARKPSARRGSHYGGRVTEAGQSRTTDSVSPYSASKSSRIR